MFFEWSRRLRRDCTAGYGDDDDHHVSSFEQESCLFLNALRATLHKPVFAGDTVLNDLSYSTLAAEDCMKFA